MNGLVVGALISVVFGIGGWFLDTNGLMKQPAYFALYGFCFGMGAAFAVAGVFK